MTKNEFASNLNWANIRWPNLNLTNDSLNSLYEDFKGFSSSSLSKALKLLFNNGNTFLEWPKLLQLTKDMYSDELLDRPRLDQPKNENGLKDYLKENNYKNIKDAIKHRSTNE